MRNGFARLARDRRGLALVEFAYSLPVLILLSLGGAELANYATTKMRASALATQIADNASRIGTGDALAAKRISETLINDVLLGAEAQAGSLGLMSDYSEKQANGSWVTRAKARIILSSIEVDTANPALTRTTWQRCRGLATSFTSQFGAQGTTRTGGVGPAGRTMTPTNTSAVMLAEVSVRYEPLFFGLTSVMPYADITTLAGMVVRDDRDYSQVYNTEGATPAIC